MVYVVNAAMVSLVVVLWLEAGYGRAARIFTSGTNLIIYGLSDSPCETQLSVAVSIVDWINGTIDTTTSVLARALTPALRGFVSPCGFWLARDS